MDPLVCTRCGQKMQTIAFLPDQLSIRKILDYLGLSTPPQDKPPPVREITPPPRFTNGIYETVEASEA